MVGIDVTKEAIEMTKGVELNKPKGIQYHIGSICNLSMFKDEMFDAVVSNIVLCDLQDMNKAIAEIYRVLESKGRLVFSIMHPCFTTPPHMVGSRGPWTATDVKTGSTGR
jgi:ubiquinone/menaquinone biosynthesis C-methylase UbiE